MTSDVDQDLQAARYLAEAGVPIFIARPSPDFPEGGHGDTGYQFPRGWQRTRPDPEVVDQWGPGDALCAVTGHLIDGLDLDPRNGGQIPDDLKPTSYGTQSTPSGGTHDLIAALGVQSRDGILPGVDVKAGVSGLGSGFLFLAPTRKKSKTTGEVGVYHWERLPDLDPLLLIGPDSSGQPLAELIQAGRSGSSDLRVDYDGPSYRDLTDQQKSMADSYVETELWNWKVRLGDASGWPEGERDDKGRGWEALARDAAWALAMIAVCPWVALDPDDAGDTYRDLLPEVMAQDPKCKGKWYEGILEKAAARPVELPPWWSDTFFDRTPQLRHVRDAARSRMLSPEGLLASTLGRILVEVPPTVQLPPTLGSPAGLNVGIALVAGPGGGKSATVATSRELLGSWGYDQEDAEYGMGSGEGMIDVFLEPEVAMNDKGEAKPTGQMTMKADPRAMFIVDEISQLSAIGSERKGSTLPNLLRSALTSGPLQMSNARAGGRSRNVRPGTYRLVVMVGVQPSMSGVLLSEASEGTPQRFLWVSMADPTAPDIDDLPQWPGPLGWGPPTEWPQWVQYPDHVLRELRQARAVPLQWDISRVDSTDDEGLEGHTMLLRLKVAFALALLHGEDKISDLWWSMAGELCDRSKDLQRECLRHLGRSSQDRTYRAERNRVIALERVSEDRLERAAKAVVARLKKNPGEDQTWTKVKPAFRLRDGLDTEEILAVANEADGVTAWRDESRNAWMLRYEP